MIDSERKNPNNAKHALAIAPMMDWAYSIGGRGVCHTACHTACHTGLVAYAVAPAKRIL